MTAASVRQWNKIQVARHPLAQKQRISNYLRSLLNIYGFSSKYLMNTEVGLRCYKLADIYCNSAYPTSANYQNTKAYFLVQSFVIAASLGLNANIWYNYYGWDYSGLYNAGTGRVGPSYNAYKFTRGAIIYLRQQVLFHLHQE